MASAAAVAMPSQPLPMTKPVLSTITASLPKPVIPTILITPPDTAPQYSISLPEQQYEKSVLFVPVKTEELGWDEHGLYWNGTYAYPVHQIYNKQGRPIGRRRRGPAGYRFEEYYTQTPQSSSPSSTSDDAVEAKVRLDEPAPARIEKTTLPPVSDDVEASTDDEEEDVASPASPSLSVGSDLTEDDASSLWSRTEADSSDDEVESSCTSPGLMSPPMDLDASPSLQADKLSAKLSDLDAGNKPTTSSWVSLGTLPSSSPAASSSASSSRSQSLPVPRSKPALELSRAHRATSTLVVDDSRRHSSGSYSSIIHDLTTSPFAPAAKTPYRSATLPRSSSRAASRGTILRPPPHFVPSREARKRSSEDFSGKASRGRLEAEHDFAAGWTFENASSMPLVNDY
ncbi:hypothetical protein PSEUBRA_002422 [Kalmanozyma brasiliensis GHG001]|uniref:Uncharacterized protein n=1 Tax=Kalmanozyma brasiliensis (strain GHG001) TaxID=1365824 RepID=V5GQ25_KALBG|nr:uncharacterized protein PSEUBRA_002422 [Kalmanozyma brasiliensis GHG001]EST08027.1 hypothetical protein PSEUBRA_002422 [Kalmanozyma brasiliensis GHG001]